ncbi:MAG: 30S ribosomal protein S11 [Candidatus Nealsonbacteria bacterium RIFCSPLOWO2_12_FULL_39_31]|uniref:Small ribosomal subunit protein uS11 n=3 Tax=Candidatus Nealsoniibacteriota TaxID=1817911 RepID=A0A1G2EGP6_9BACT|nr:MAG: 30S ribosomal protein S11 [Parcubacteria group bacterium GW2011_GWA2_38_27]KKQ98067.1 MAG: 30S ribosomal protein S11 [Parcubacteria group bacterium GW2011_GWC2_39_11]OGZ19440.1 MAG: 30S ribosomal protein S11 [Candidatus Nealsonbacteria bacterium RIFCSPHIGHO2_01_FULL_38_55]OGZ21173.1 MAG: 30S ribosomal protein S11 [Candidatus Nealsonbacteria bacterium RIFCSPHIGHO2_02_38_10]OGZ21477.1 MAG: 30S ribosomal protein S11 [Candidatus Nealsonbacteria bacterium RIFCSPHIGHO2_02_FULL_38_75]OGZ22608
MGKKRIIKPLEEELLKEREKVDAKAKNANVRTALASEYGRIYVYSSYNNTILTLTGLTGDVLSWASAGAIGFKGSKKATPFAASKVAEKICLAAQKLGVAKVSVFVRGIGGGRESAIRSLAGRGLEIISIADITPVPHNGCRPPKARRV